MFLFQFPKKRKDLPKELRTFLVGKKFTKVGVQISSDTRKVKDTFGVRLEKPFELVNLSHECGFSEKRKDNLANLTNKILGYNLDKNLQRSIWSTVLSKEKMEYASRDALASLLIYKKLLTVPKRPFSMPRNLSPQSSQPSASSVETDHVSPVEKPRPKTRVCLDPFHALKRINETISIKHPLAFVFYSHLRDAVLVPNPEDIRKVSQVLAMNGSSYESKLLSNKEYIFARVRRTIPEPSILRRNIETVISHYQEMFQAPQEGLEETNGVNIVDEEDENDGELFDPDLPLTPDVVKKLPPLINKKTEKEVQKLLEHVDRGCLSDPPGISLYYDGGKDRDGLQLFHCVRGTNDLEGAAHRSLSMNFLSSNGGIRHSDGILRLMRHRHNIRASEKYRKDFPKLGFYDHYIIDEIFSIREDLGRPPLFKWWPSAPILSDDGSLDPGASVLKQERFGIVPNSREYKQDYDGVFPEGMSQNMKDLAKLMGVKIPYLNVITSKEKSMYQAALERYKKGIDWATFASDWNSGSLGMEPDGIKIFRKTQDALKRYFNSSKKRYERSTVYKYYMPKMSPLVSHLAQVEMKFSSPALKKPIQVPFQPDEIIDLISDEESSSSDEETEDEEIELVNPSYSYEIKPLTKGSSMKDISKPIESVKSMSLIL